MRRHSGKSAMQLLIKSHVSLGWGDKLLHLLPSSVCGIALGGQDTRLWVKQSEGFSCIPGFKSRLSENLSGGRGCPL